MFEVEFFKTRGGAGVECGAGGFGVVPRRGRVAVGGDGVVSDGDGALVGVSSCWGIGGVTHILPIY